MLDRLKLELANLPPHYALLIKDFCICTIEECYREFEVANTFDEVKYIQGKVGLATELLNIVKQKDVDYERI